MTRELTVRDIDALPAEPRIRDVVVAERLGFERPRKIRELIERNREELESYGPLAPRRGAKLPSDGEVSRHGGAKPLEGSSGGRPEEGCLLNEEQALLVCMFSRTPQAAAVRREVIQVFTAWRRGHLEAPAAAAPINDPLWRGMDGRIGITNRMLDLEARSTSEDYVRAAAFLPRQGRNYRQPAFFSNKPLVKMLIDLHRQVTIQEAMEQIKARFGWSPSMTAIHRFWQRLDGARGSKFITA
jgi:hypothetical protein